MNIKTEPSANVGKSTNLNPLILYNRKAYPLFMIF